MPERFPTLRPLAAALALLAFTLAPQAASAADPIRTVLNGRELAFDAPPIIENDRTLVPLRGILEPMGAGITWHPETRTVTAQLNGHEVKVAIDSAKAEVDGVVVTMDLPAKITADRTFIPLRFFAENLGMQVGWDGETRTITIDSREATPPSRDSGTATRAGNRLVEVARQYIGSPYAWGGTSPETGFDCSGFMLFVAKQVGVSLPRTSQEQALAGIPVERANLIAGDLVFFSTYAPGASHAGVYDGNGSFIHAGSEGKGVVITPLSNVYWSQRFVGARRVVR